MSNEKLININCETLISLNKIHNTDIFNERFLRDIGRVPIWRSRGVCGGGSGVGCFRGIVVFRECRRGGCGLVGESSHIQ